MGTTVGATDVTGTSATSYAESAQKKSKVNGKTIGEPQLSEKGAKYYEQLKAKYGNYDFILVSKDQKENAQANAALIVEKFKTLKGNVPGLVDIESGVMNCMCITDIWCGFCTGAVIRP